MGRVYMDVDRDIQALGRSLRTAHWSSEYCSEQWGTYDFQW
jgi:hypothetical protein